MSLQNALSFIQQIQIRPDLQTQLEHFKAEPDLERLVSLGREHGYVFSASELRTAFARDWAMRRFRFSGRTDCHFLSDCIGNRAD